MKRSVSVMLSLFLLSVLLLSGCGQESGLQTSKPHSEAFSAFVGQWECEANPLNDPNNFTGYLRLEIGRDYGFSLYDGEDGALGISGKLFVLDDCRLQISCADNLDFLPPPVWCTMRTNQELTYEFKTESKGKLYLTYEDEETGDASTLIFTKVKK